MKVTDANGCEEGTKVQLTQPERSDWTMSGNAGTDPATQYIGTSDAKDVVLKANGQESMRLKANGDISLMGSLSGDGPLYRRDDGLLGSGFPVYPERPAERCHLLGSYPYWETRGNAFHQLCPGEDPRLGTLGDRPLKVITNGQTRMLITTEGRVAIGGVAPVHQFEVHTAMERSGITLNNTRTDANAHTEIRFMKNGDGRWALGCDMEANGGQDFFIWDQPATMKRLVINGQGKVGIGVDPPINSSIYNLYVANGIATRDVKVTSGTWPDYVFADGYRLMPLPELRAFLQRNRHLPGIPSAAEVERNEGVEVGDMQARLLKALEEQALYILHLEERIKALEER